MNEQLVSILMPVKNAGPYLNDCIASIVNQTYTNWELLAVNDHSSDDSKNILEIWAAKDDRISITDNKSKGIIPALSNAFERSRGQYITRMDSDDLMPENKLTLFFNAIANESNTVITGKVKYFSDEDVSEGYLRYEEWINGLIDTKSHWNQIYRECVIASPNWMVERSFFQEQLLFSDLNYPEDYDMTFHWYRNNYQVVGINEITHLWREHPKRTSRNSEVYQQKAFFKLKTNRFVDLEIEDSDTVQLIGTGVKGRLVADTLLKRGIMVKCFDMNAGLLKTSRGELTVFPVQELKREVKTILTNWPIDKKTQLQIRKFMEMKDLEEGRSYWLF